MKKNALIAGVVAMGLISTSCSTLKNASGGIYAGCGDKVMTITENGNGLELPGTLKNISFVDATVKGYGGFLGMKGQGTLENVYMLVKIKPYF